MPFKDKRKKAEAQMNWARRNPEKIKQYKRRHKEKRNRLKKIVRLVTLQPKRPTWKSLPLETRYYYYKLRRNGMDFKSARLIIYGEEFGNSCSKNGCKRFIPQFDLRCKEHAFIDNWRTRKKLNADNYRRS